MDTPSYHQHEEFNQRVKKREEIKDLGIDPYPHKYEPNDTAEYLHNKYEGKEIGHSAPVHCALSLNPFGKLPVCQIQVFVTSSSPP